MLISRLKGLNGSLKEFYRGFYKEPSQKVGLGSLT